MKELVQVLSTVDGPKAERLAAQKAFLERRHAIWEDIHEGKFPATYTSANNKKFVGAPRRTAIRWEVSPNRTGKRFYCCPKCTSKLYECVRAKVFRYIDNAKWKAEIETS